MGSSYWLVMQVTTMNYLNAEHLIHCNLEIYAVKSCDEAAGMSSLREDEITK